MKTSEIKTSLLASCRQYVEDRIESIQESLISAREGASDDTKSSSGDKYETNRAMMHLEMEKLGEQLAEAQRMLETVHQTPTGTSQNIGQGSLVRTTNGNFFLSVGAGRLVLDAQDYFAISSAAPIAAAMKGLAEGDTFEINSRTFTIMKIE